MRRSRQRKKMIGIRQAGVWNAGASSVPSYESFTIATARSFPPKETQAGNNMDISLTGSKRPASDAEQVQDFASFGTLLQHVLVERGDSDGASTSHQSLDGGVVSARPLQQASDAGVKQIVVRLSGLRQAAVATSRESFSVNHDEPVKDIRTKAEYQHEMHRATWSNGTDWAETNRQNDHTINCHYPDFQSSQNAMVTPNVRNVHQALQIPGETRESKEESAEAQNEDIPGPATCGDESGGSTGNLPAIDESCCVLESSNGQARSGQFEHDLPGRSAGGSFPHPANPSWIQPSANVCRSCPATLSMNNQAVNGCNACVGTRFTAPYTFQRGVPRAVRYCVEPASLSQMKCYTSRIDPPACCQRMDYEAGGQPQVMYAQTLKQGVDHVHPQTVRSRNHVVIPSRASEGHTCETHYISGDDVLVCPAPWVHNGRIFPGVPAMCVGQPQKYDSVGVNWAPEMSSETSDQNQPQTRQSDSSKLMEESQRRGIADPVYPPAHCNNHSTNFSADLDMEIQRQLEEQIAHEIFLLSQKLANLQARYGARRPFHGNTKPAVLSCPQTPLLLDNPLVSQRDAKCNSRAPSTGHSMRSEDTTQPRSGTSSSSKSTYRQQPDSRCLPEDRKLGGRKSGTNKGVSSTTGQCNSNRGCDSGTSTVSFNANRAHHPNSRAAPSGSHTSRNSTAGSRASLTTHYGCLHGATEATPVQNVLTESVGEAGKASSKSRTFASPHRKGREKPVEELAEGCSYSDDMKEYLRTGGANVQGYPNGNKRFDWVKTLRFGGVGARDNQGFVGITSQVDSKSSSPQEFTVVDAETWLRDSSEHERFARETMTPTSMSKSVQAGGVFPEVRGGTPTDLDHDNHNRTESRPKRRSDSSIENKPGKTGKRAPSPDEMGGLDSRLAHHLVKAGLRRAPSFWRVPGISRVPNTTQRMNMKKKTFRSRSPRKDSGKRFRRRTLFDLNPQVDLSQVDLSEVDPPEEKEKEKVGARKEGESQLWTQLKEEAHTRESCELDAIDAQWQKEVGDYEAEYETFVENTDVGLHDDPHDTEEYTSVVNREAPTNTRHSEEDLQKRSTPSSISTHEKARLSEVSMQLQRRMAILLSFDRHQHPLTSTSPGNAQMIDTQAQVTKHVMRLTMEEGGSGDYAEGATCQGSPVAPEQAAGNDPQEPPENCMHDS